MTQSDVIVVWCDSTSGKVSVRVCDSGLPVRFDSDELPDSIPIVSDEEELFEKLRQRNGDKIAVPVDNVYPHLGWTI